MTFSCLACLAKNVVLQAKRCLAFLDCLAYIMLTYFSLIYNISNHIYGIEFLFMNPLTLVLLLLGGYFVGSLSPSYLLGKIFKNIDIREHGTKNAGTVNTYKVLGLGPAIFAAVIDLSKGLLVMYVAYLLGASPLLMHIASLAAILGHVFPPYLNFRGGQGVATASAILIYYVVLFYLKAWLPWESLPLLVFCVLSFIYIAKQGEIIGSVMLPILGIFVLVFVPFPLYQLFILTIIIYILFINILNIFQRQLLTSSSKKAKKEINWRFFARPLAVLLIIYYLRTDKKEALTLIGSIALFFLLLDLSRLFSNKINIFFFKYIKKLYKSKEYSKFSSITLFLFSIFLVVLLVDKPIACLAGFFLIFGDLFSKFFGIHFGRTKIFEKSLEGSLAHFNACLISGYIFIHFFSVPIPVYLLGSLVASLSEVLPLGVDDNFSVALLSASSMYVAQLF